jgi:hypothetical protein
MVFEEQELVDRYATEAEAHRGHEAIVRLLRDGQDEA